MLWTEASHELWINKHWEVVAVAKHNFLYIFFNVNFSFYKIKLKIKFGRLDFFLIVLCLKKKKLAQSLTKELKLYLQVGTPPPIASIKKFFLWASWNEFEEASYLKLRI